MSSDMEAATFNKVRKEDDPLFIPPTPNPECLLCRMMWKYWKVNLNTSNADIVHFDFPDDPRTFKSWCRRIRNVFYIPGRMYGNRICSLHFEAKDFSGERTLAPKAVPVVHDYKHYIDKETASKRDTTPLGTCYICHKLKDWKIDLNPKKAPVKLFQFPENGDGDAWRLAIRQVYTSKPVHKEAMICGLHFKDTDFVDDTHQQLKPDAFPIVHKYSHYFAVNEMKVPNRKTKPTREVVEKIADGECLLCTLLSKWKIKLNDPSKDVKLFPMPKDGSAWKTAIKAIHINIDVSNETVICSLHFRPSDFVDASKQELKPTAVPIVHRYSYYFNIAMPKQKTIMAQCLVCSFLKARKVKLKSTTGQVAKLFALPKGDKNWTPAIRKIYPSAKIGEDTMICALHFRSADFVDDTRQILQPSAIPIILPPSFYPRATSSTVAATTTTAIGSPKVIVQLPKRKAAPANSHAMKLVKGDQSKSGSDCEDYIEIDWMKY